MNRYFKGCQAILAVVVASLLLSGASFAADPAPENPKAATVNGTVISKSDIDIEIGKVRQYLARRGQEVDAQQLNSLRDRILDDLIQRELLYQASLQERISADPEIVQNEISEMKKNFEKPEDFTAALAGLQMTEEQITAAIGRDLTIQKFVQEKILAGITVTDAEKKEFYDAHPEFFKRPEQIRASHILAQLDEKAGEEEKAAALQKIEAVRKKLKDGGDFAEIAKTDSDGPSAASGGDLGFFARGQMVQPFEDAAFALQVGGVSDIVQTRFGYHIIRLTDRQPEGTLGFAEEAEKIGQHLQQTKSQQAVRVYIDKLKESAAIEKFL